MLHHLLYASHDFFLDLFWVSRLIQEDEEIFFEEYLELNIIEDLYRSCAWLVSDERHLSEKWTWTKESYLIAAAYDFYMSRIDIVGTSVWCIADTEDDFSFSPMLRLTHEEKICDFFFGKTIENIEGICWCRHRDKVKYSISITGFTPFRKYLIKIPMTNGDF